MTSPERAGQGQSRVVALWAVPRSVSTAFERTFAQRADTEVVHEPFTDCYYFSEHRRSSRYGSASALAGYDGEAAVAAISSVRAPLVFVKDLCFQAEPYVTDDFLDGVVNTFIIRDPQAVLRSLAPLKPDFSEDEFGFLAFARLWHRVVDGLGHRPIVIDGDRFRANPEAILRQYCHTVGVDFDPAMLRWEDGRIRSWGDHERDSQAKWHHTLETSTGILPPPRWGSPVQPVPAGRSAMVRRAAGIARRTIHHALDGDVAGQQSA
jgi:Sulfotransferase domain